MKERRKQSLIAGGLTSSAGIFITKALGIIYVSPLLAMAGEVNMGFYSSAYGIYDFLLNISLAGLPFAIATVVTKYSLKNDYKSVLLIRKLSISIMVTFGFIACVGVLLFASPIAVMISSKEISVEDLEKTRNVIMIISLALFTVPLLSSYRGFFQGLKDFKSYAFSQVLEQFSRIAFLLGMGALAVYVFDQEGIWAIYFAVASTSVSAITAIIYFVFFKKDAVMEVKKLAREQEIEPANQRELVRELFNFALPYLAVTILGNSMNIFNLAFFYKGMDLRGEDYTLASTLYGMIMTQTNKLTSIPQVLAPGFSIAIVPFITACYEKRDYKMMKKYVLDALDTVIYLGLPICFCLFALSTEIYYVFYGSGNSNYILGGEVLAWASLLAVVGTISPVVNGLMMALRLRKANFMILLLGFAIKGLSIIPLIYYTGYSGAITSSAITSFFIIFADIIVLKKTFHIRFTPTVRKCYFIALGLLGMWGVFFLLRTIGLPVVGINRIAAVCTIGIYGFLGLLVYFGITYFFQLPQVIFQMDLSTMKNKFKRKIGK